ncbi:TLDc domain-containing protein [Entamoeba marina]
MSTNTDSTQINNKKFIGFNDPIDLLKKWSNKTTFNVVFDSDINGNGENVLLNLVFNKSNLYFISFDENNNVYGGYIGNEINRYNQDILDENAFVFSLIRNGKVNNRVYSIHEGENRAFWLFSKNSECWLYAFADFVVSKIGVDLSFCVDDNFFYDYKNDITPLTYVTYPKKFIVERVIALQMN